jgi:hypothetical protein
MKSAFLSTVIISTALAAAACGGSERADQAASAPKGAPAAPAQKIAYPEPRYPSYLKPPTSVADIMPQARLLARNKSGFQGSGMGVVNGGDSIAIVQSSSAEPMVVEAITRALGERGVKVTILNDYELVGLTRDQVEGYRKARQAYTSEQGYMEAANWIEANFPDSEKTKAWLKGRRPDLYEKLFPKTRDLTPELTTIRDRMREVGPGIVKWLNAHKDVRGVFWGKGGSTSLRRNMHPLENKFLGLFTADNRYDVMSPIVSYPGDLWLLAEEQGMEPIVYVDRIEITDPEGTHITSEINEIQAQRWARGSYQRGHLYMFPNQATGRFGYSVVDYPSFTNEFLPREPLATVNGTVAGTVNHTGFYPWREVTFKDGYIVGVKGEGVFAETLREFLQYPHINDLSYPFHSAEHKGYWYLYEIAFGTHPKGFRNPRSLEQGRASDERLRSGVIHWGLGITVHHEPSGPTKSQKWLDFTAQYNLPRDHGFHTHTYFTTYRVHLRNADKWINLLDKGHLTSLDNPEVRALASRYGDPNQLLTEDWVPEIPGINAPGEYQKDYGADPWKVTKRVLDDVAAGTYTHYYPAQGAPAQPKTTN